MPATAHSGCSNRRSIAPTVVPAQTMPALRPGAAMRSDLCWIGREVGSGARQCLEELPGSRRVVPRFMASDHRGVAEAVRSGWADAGVCLRLVSEEAGLDFLAIRQNRMTASVALIEALGGGWSAATLGTRAGTAATLAAQDASQAH